MSIPLFRTLRIRSLVCLFTFALITATTVVFFAARGETRSEQGAGSPTRSAARQTKPVTSLVDLSRKKASCCTAQAEPSEGLLGGAIEADTYRLTGTYYSLRNGLRATLMFNNKGPEPIMAMPTLYSLAGTRLQLAPISVPATSYIDVDMEELLVGATDEFREGSVRIGYQGISQQLGAQIRLTDPENNLIFAEQLSYTNKFVSSRLDNVWWLPFQNTETKVVVSNTSGGTVSATLTVDGTSPHQFAPMQLTLAPWETRVLDILRDIAGHEHGHVHTSGGISITHTGNPGALMARMFVSKADKGYSSANNFIDPEASASQRWHGNGVRFRNLDGSQVKPVLAVRNSSAQPSNLTGRIIYTDPNGDVVDILIPSKSINAGAAKHFDLSQLINQLPASVTFGGIELQYDTPPGSITTQLQSLSQNGEHVFQVPMFDPQNTPSSAGGFPWKADGDFSTLVYIKNETDAPQKYTVHLTYIGGHYSLGIKHLKGGETAAIDFRALRDAQSPNQMGNVIPLDVDTGQIAWSVQGFENKVLSARSEQIDLTKGLASTYSCANCCPNTVQSMTLEPGSVSVLPSETFTISALQMERDCNSTVLGPYYSESVVWSISDTSYAFVDEYGTIEGVDPGSTSIQASLDYPEWQNMGTWCQDHTRNVKRTALVSVANDIVFSSVSNDVNSSIASFSSGFGLQTAGVNLLGGREVCVGDRDEFWITVNFQLPTGALSIFHPDARTFISDTAHQQFQYLTFNFEDVSYYTGAGKLKVRLRRVRPEETDRSIKIQISGGRQGGGAYTGTAKILFACTA